MTTALIPLSLGGTATPYNDGTGAFGMQGNNSYGYKTYFFPMLSEIVLACQAAVTAGNTAVNAPGSAGTSTTSLTIGTGTQTFTTQTGKAWSVGQPAMIASTASPTNWMAGTITAYNSGTGAMTVVTSASSGSGTFTAWTVSLCGPVLPAAGLPKNRIINSQCLVAQYGSRTLAATGNIYGGCDRYLNSVSATTVSASFAQSASPAPSGPGAQGFAQLMTVTSTGSTSISWSQRIEAKNCADMNGKTVTFKGVVYQNTGAPVGFSAAVLKANSVDNFTATTSLVVGGTVSVPSGVPTVVLVTVLLGSTDASNGLQVGLSSAAMAALTAKSFWTSGWWFDVGSTAPSVEEPVDYAQELLRCQRYYEQSYAPGTVAASITTQGAEENTANTGVFLEKGSTRFKTSKRSAPTMAFYSPNSGTVAKVAEYNTGGTFVADRVANLFYSTEEGFALSSSSMTAASIIRYQWTASAEL